MRAKVYCAQLSLRDLGPRGAGAFPAKWSAGRETRSVDHYSSDTQPVASRTFLSGPVMIHCSEKFTYLGI
ncbi:hypothetical protein TNCV_1021821 [Trichonephila clavipes]|nr:hypothetical protein TNCV_1021821 [Trichonephila clavipes]